MGKKTKTDLLFDMFDMMSRTESAVVSALAQAVQNTGYKSDDYDDGISNTKLLKKANHKESKCNNCNNCNCMKAREDRSSRNCIPDMLIVQPVYIVDVKFNGPATIVFWSDGTKTVAKCDSEDQYNKVTGLSLAINKKFMTNAGLRDVLDAFVYDTLVYEQVEQIYDMINNDSLDEKTAEEFKVDVSKPLGAAKSVRKSAANGESKIAAKNFTESVKRSVANSQSKAAVKPAKVQDKATSRKSKPEVNTPPTIVESDDDEGE